MFLPKHPKAQVRRKTNNGKNVTFLNEKSGKQFEISNGEDSDFEYNLPLIHIKEAMKDWSGVSPIVQRTRLSKKKTDVIRCDEEEGRWGLDDYERYELTDDENVSAGVSRLSPMVSKKKIKISGQHNAVTSTPKRKNLKMPDSILLPPIEKDKDNAFKYCTELSSTFEGDSALDNKMVDHDDFISYNWTSLHKKLLRCDRFVDVKMLAQIE